MFEFEKIDLNLSFNYIYLILGIIFLAGYAYYVYRFTLPPVSTFKRYLLLTIRSFALILLLFIFFEPVIALTKKVILTPENLFYFDDSRSMRIEDKSERLSTIRELIKKVRSASLNGNTEYYSLGSNVKKLNPDSLNELKFSQASTDFSTIFKDLSQNNKNIASISIISDGVITQGTTPVYSAEKLGIPVFTIGIGDSTVKNDIEIKNILHNDYIYSETPTTILATILNKGFSDKSTVASLLDGNQLIEQKKLILNKSGVNSVSFEFTPKQSGEKKLSVKINPLEGESSSLNNQKVFYINVLSNKINVLLISGKPSSDLTFIKNVLSNDKNLKVNTLVQISPGNFLEQNANSKLDSADVIYLIGYPTQSVSEVFYKRLVDKLENKNTPLFFILTSEVSISNLYRLKDILPFSIQRIENNYLQVQPDIQTTEVDNPIVQSNTITDWKNLPPVSQPIALVTINPESNIIAKVYVGNSPRNNPLIVTKSFGAKRSIGVLAEDIWRWKLQTANKNLSLFDNFIVNSTRWLNAPEDKKRVKIITSKKLYSSGELIEFSAQVYNEAFDPVNEAEVKINITNSDSKSELILNSVGSGLYEGTFSSNKNGDYSFLGTASYDGKLLGSDGGSFNVGDVDIEFLDTRMNYQFLNLLSTQTKGKYFAPNKINDLLTELNNINLNASKEKFITLEIRLWSNEWLLFLVILLFGTEWFFRKRSGML
jgi:hypothetical protein